MTDDSDLNPWQPNSARVSNRLLGGKDYYPNDRRVVEQLLNVMPTADRAARTNRAFMHRAIDYVARQGIRQFLDIGTGFPTPPNVHEIAQAVIPHAAVTYVDKNPVVLAHARVLHVGTTVGRINWIDADLTAPETIVEQLRQQHSLDLTEPVAVSLLSVMHFITDNQDPHQAVRTMLDALAPGSHLIMSHATGDFNGPVAEQAADVYWDNGIPFQPRSRAEFAAFFLGLEAIAPGIVTPHRWRQTGIELPRTMDARVSSYCAVGQKPQRRGELTD